MWVATIESFGTGHVFLLCVKTPPSCRVFKRDFAKTTSAGKCYFLKTNYAIAVQACPKADLDLIKGHHPAETKKEHAAGLPVATKIALAALANPSAVMV